MSPKLATIAVGPTIEHVPSPDERREIASVGKVRALLETPPRRIVTSPLSAADRKDRGAAIVRNYNVTRILR